MLKDSIANINNLYINAKFQEALNNINDIISADYQNFSHDDKIYFLSTALRVISKIQPQEELKNGILSNFLQLDTLPIHIQDKLLFLNLSEAQQLSNQYYKLLSNYLSTFNQELLLTISYKHYLQNPKNENTYKYFTGEQLIPEPFFDYNKILSSYNSYQDFFANMNLCGFVAQVLMQKNEWSDSLPHKLIWNGLAEQATIFLKQADVFSSRVLQKYLYDLKNHQNENWLHDVTTLSPTSELVDNFADFLNKHKMQHLLLFKHQGKPYFQKAINSDHFNFVMKILRAIKDDYDLIQIEQREFNIAAYNFLQIAVSEKQEELVLLLRSMGAIEQDLKFNEYEKLFVADDQNVHHRGFSDAISSAITQLRGYYESTDITEACHDFQTFFYEQPFDSQTLYNFLNARKLSLLENVKTSTNEIKSALKLFFKGAEFTLSRIITLDPMTPYDDQLIANVKNREFPQTEIVYKTFTLEDVLAYVWTGLKDPEAITESTLDEDTILERKLSLLLVLYEIFAEGEQPFINQNKKRDIAGDVIMLSTTETEGSKQNTHGMICIPGVFDRILQTLDHQHKVVNIEIDTNTFLINIDAGMLREKINSIYIDLIKDVNVLMRAKIFDHLFLFQSNADTKLLESTFLPIHLYLNGFFKSKLNELEVLGYFGKSELTHEHYYFLEQHIISKLLEKFTENIKLSNILDFKILIDNIGEKTYNDIQNKLTFIEQQTSLVPISNAELVTIKTIETALYMSHTLLETKTPTQEQLLLNYQMFIASLPQSSLTKDLFITYIIQKIVDLSKETSLNDYDLIKIHIITSDYGLFSKQAILSQLIKYAILNDNETLLRLTLNKAEYFYEQDLLSQPQLQDKEKYNNKYIEEIAGYDFCDGMTILHLASEHSSKNIINILLHYHEIREKIDHQDQDGRTAFYISVLHNKQHTIEALRIYGADMNLYDCFGNTPLLIAARNQNFDLVKKLIASGANPYVCDNMGGTFLHNAAIDYTKGLDKYLEDITPTTKAANFLLSCFENPIESLIRDNEEEMQLHGEN